MVALNNLDIRDIAIIDAFPVYKIDPTVLNVGCGKGRIDFHLFELGYNVYATDYRRHDTWNDLKQNDKFLKFSIADIFNIDSFPIKNAPVVICSEVLEHLIDYRKALKNLLRLTKIRLIITVPFETSFDDKAPPPIGHCNFWSDEKKKRNDVKFKDIKEIHKLCKPNSVSISRIRTKVLDVKMKQYSYLIIVDKRQNLVTDN